MTSRSLNGAKWKNEFVFVNYEGNEEISRTKISDISEVSFPQLKPGERIAKLTALTIDLPIPHVFSPNILKQMLTHHLIEVETENGLVFVMSCIIDVNDLYWFSC